MNTTKAHVLKLKSSLLLMASRKLLRLYCPSLNRSNSAEIRSYSIAFPPLWVSMNSVMVELNAVATIWISG